MSTTKKVLMLLEKNKGIYLSGEDIASSISLSRTSVWKAISSLKKAGYQINSSTKLGYKLENENDIISSEGIKCYLNTNLMDIPILTFETVDSTNKIAKKMLLEGAKDKTIIISNEQTDGKGRLGKKFFSPKNSGIYMSILLKFDEHLTNPLSITTSSCVSICHAIESLSNASPKIKWVNDIYIDNKKLCGILTEAVINCESNEITSVVLGIGINVTTSSNDFPKELKDIATSLFAHNDLKFTKNQLIAEIINNIFQNIYSVNDDIMKEYKDRSIVIGKDIKYLLNNNWFFGTAVDINKNGNLLVKTEQADIIELNSGEITLRLNDKKDV